MRMIQGIHRFAAELGGRRLSPHTIKAYRNDLLIFARNSGILGLGGITVDAARSFFQDQARYLAARTVRRRIVTLKLFTAWATEEGLLKSNPLEGFRNRVKLPVALPRLVTRNEVRQLLRTAGDQARGTTGLHWKTIEISIELLFGTGVRVGELVAIACEDINHEDGMIVIHGKGQRQRRVYLPTDEVKERLVAYEEARKNVIPQTKALLVSDRGTAVTTSYIRAGLHELTRAAGIDKTITPHMFRHTIATCLLEEGVDIRHVQRLLGHASIATTERYTHVADVTLRRVLTAHHPRRSILG